MDEHLTHQSQYFIRPGFHVAEEALRFGLAGACAEKSTSSFPVFWVVIKCSHISNISILSDLSDPPISSILQFRYPDI